MSRVQVQICGGLLLFSLVVGWIGAGIGNKDASALADGWRGDTTLQNTHPDYEVLRQQLLASGLFPLSEARQRELDAAAAKSLEENQNLGAGPFPDIIAVSLVDGVGQVHLRLDDNRIIAARAGDMLDAGWELKMIDLDRVLAISEGTEHEFLVINYEEQADAGAEDTLDNTGKKQ